MEFLKLWKIQKTFQSGSSNYTYTVSQREGRIQALHINLTDLAELTGNESFWSKMKVNIQLLDVLHNRLQVLPHCLSEYSKSLEVVGCAFNSFQSIPEVFFSCSRLQNINLYHNELHFIDQRIGKLRCLNLLDLGRNRIDILPNVFDELPNLQIFILEGNLLSAIPSSFSKLCSLNTLSLADNMLKDFPSPLIDLKNLKTLNLHYNRIQHIPDVVYPLIQRLQEITLQDNPLRHQVLAKLRTERLQHYIREHSINQDFANSRNLRVLVVGECGSGKTSLVEALCKSKYVAPFKRKTHDHTVGINCYKWPLYCSDQSFDISVWDFGGEKSYSMMNQLFLSDCTLIWIVVNAQTFDYVMSIKSWLNAILSTCEEVDLTIVVTHSDEVDNREKLRQIVSDIRENVREQLQDYTSSSEEFLLSETACDSAVSKDCQSRLSHCASSLLTRFSVIPVTNAFPLTGHQELQESVIQMIESNRFNLKSPLPLSWSKAEQHLLEISQSLISRDQPAIKKADEVAKVLSGIIDDGSECKRFLQYLHQAGEILIYESPSNEEQQLDKSHTAAPGEVTEKSLGLSSTSMIVLRPSWLVFVLKTIFCHDFSEKLKIPAFRKRILHQARRNNISLTNDDIIYFADTLTQQGMIPLTLLQSLWSNVGIGKHSDFLLSILKKVGIAFKNVVQNPHNVLEEIEDPAKCKYLFPWLLRDDSGTGDQPKSKCHCQTSEQKVLVVRYSFTATPFGLFERYLVNLHNLRDIHFLETKRHYIEAKVSPENRIVHVHHVMDECCSDIIISCFDNVSSQNSVWDTVSKFLCVLNNHLKAVHCCKPSQYVQCPNNAEHLIKLTDFMGHSIRKPVVCNMCVRTTGKGDLETWIHVTAEGKLT